MEPFFPGFRIARIPTGDATLHAEVGGSGPPLLLLHGYPQTHVAWHKVAPGLARHFTVVAPDLRGYGDSVGPPGDPLHHNYSKRVMAQDMLALMRALGFERFAIAGHDRGGRVAYRLCLDHPEAARCLVSLTVVPTEEMWRRAGMDFGLKAWHWYMLAQPYDLPERLLAAEPAYFLEWTLRNMMHRRESVTPEAMAEYQRAFAQASVRHAMIEDYRAGAFLDPVHDREAREAGRKVECPVQVLWSASAPDPLPTWRDWALQVEGLPLACGHLMAEEAPQALLDAMLPFLRRHGNAG
jgi:haloacetate dehalogenase